MCAYACMLTGIYVYLVLKYNSRLHKLEPAGTMTGHTYIISTSVTCTAVTPTEKVVCTAVASVHASSNPLSLASIFFGLACTIELNSQ